MFVASHHLPRGFEILRGIDGDGMIIGDDGLEGEAVGEEAQLLERFARPRCADPCQAVSDDLLDVDLGQHVDAVCTGV